jgi:cytidylate kinase
MDGRDIGTVVLPDADVKIFLTASPEARAKRRTLELVEKGQQADFDTILRDIIARDEQDANRPIAPLKQAEDAVLVDTTFLDLEQSLEALKSAAKEAVSL